MAQIERTRKPILVVSLILVLKKKWAYIADSICDCCFKNINFRGRATDVGAVWTHWSWMGFARACASSCETSEKSQLSAKG